MTIVRHAVAVAVAALALALTGAPRARAAEDAEANAKRAEAAERFDRAMALVDEKDYPGALAELKRVQEIAPHPQVLFNLGLVYAATNRPVEAVAAMEKVLDAPGSLRAESLARARAVRDEQARRTARLDVTTNVPATIEIDGIAVGTTPLGAPVPVAAGTRVVSAMGPGYLPLRKEVVVAGATTQALALELAPSELRLAHLGIDTRTPDADVYIDGERVGRTPLPGSLAVAPGRRAIELRRAGYRPARREITLDDGAKAALSFELEEERGGAGPKPGRLVLAVSEPDPDVTVDGRPRGAYREPLLLPPGAHTIGVTRAGFLPAERSLSVPEGGDVTARVTLLPTPETRAAYKSRAEGWRRWGLIGTGGGAALAAAGVAVFALNRDDLAAAEAEIAAIEASGVCDGAMNSQCIALRDQAYASFNRHTNIERAGIAGMAVGGIALAAGLVLLLGGEDPHRYDRAPREREALGGLALSGGVTPGGGRVLLGGRF